MMSNFHNINLPSYIEVFAVATIEFSTICASTRSGREVRGSSGSVPKRSYLLKDCRLSRAQFEVFNSFFYARCGKRYAFCLKDHCDFKAKKQIIGMSGVTKRFQLTKTYPDLLAPYVREITKPVGGSIVIYSNEHDVIIESIDLKSGVVSLSDSIHEGIELLADYEFNVLVRFDKDTFQYSFNEDGTISLDDIRLMEVV